MCHFPIDQMFLNKLPSEALLKVLIKFQVICFHQPPREKKIETEKQHMVSLTYSAMEQDYS